MMEKAPATKCVISLDLRNIGKGRNLKSYCIAVVIRKILTDFRQNYDTGAVIKSVLSSELENFIIHKKHHVIYLSEDFN